MKKLLLWLCFMLPFLSISQETAPVAFRLDTKQISTNVPNSDQMQVYIQTSVTGWTDIPMDDVGGNGIFRKIINISHPTDENLDVYYRFKITSFSNSGLPYTAWEGGPNADESCLFDTSTGGAPGGPNTLRKVTVPQELIDNGTYVNPSGEYKLTHCFNVCGNAPCPPDPCIDGLTSTNAYQQCLENIQALIVFEWETECEVESVSYSNVEGAGPFVYNVNPDATNFGVYAGNGQMPPNWSVEHQLVVNFADGTSSDPISYTPTPCIPGCTDPNSEAYNPWATVDDGSCSGTNCDPDTEHQITMQITLDNWPGETSWTMNSGGIIGAVTDGTYNFNDIGKTFTYNFCIDKNTGFEFIINDTYGDGIAGSTSGGTIDGSVVIYDCNGDIIWELPDPDFGEVAYSGQQFGVDCEGTEEIYGCTDPAYQSYNPDATIDDGSCTELHIVGCMDEDSINYNPDATKQELVPVCEYNLIVRDAASDGWGNSFIGVAQGGVSLGTYTLGPGIDEQSFPLSLNSDEEVVVYYFEVGNPQTTPEELNFQTLQNSFLIVDSDEQVLLDGGTNPFADNGQGALQNFEAPFFEKYSALPFCGTTCIPIVEGCMTEGSLNYNPEANVDDGSCIPYIEGCMNPLAFNYNPDATVDDGSCVEVIVGCMDPDSFNYNPEANTAGDCIPVIEGCMDPTSFNYNENANVDDGSCIPVIEGCMDENSINYNPNANTDDGSCIPIVEGCTDPDSFNYDPNANVDDGSCIPVVFGCTDPDSFNYNPDANTDNGTCEAVVFGCTDPDSFNYNPNANTDNGTCVPVVLGCTDNTSFNYNPEANTNDGSCIPILAGCTDPDSFNYNELANTDDGSCIPVVYGCTDNTSLNYNPEANTDDGSCIPILYGCMDETSFNYNPLATVDDGSCIPVVEGCTDNTSLNYNPNANVDDGSCIPILYGCMDETSFNYNPLATVDDGSCIAVVEGCTDNTSLNYNPEANVDDGSCIPILYGCMDPDSFNYNALATVDDGSCIPIVYGCTDPDALNYNPDANTEDFSCIEIVYGCTDPDSINYNPEANVDNGSCITAIIGCTDPESYNYNPEANVSDPDACLYDAGCIDGPGNPYWLNDNCYAWVIDVDSYCCDNEFDSICQEMYNYCEDGWPEGFDISSIQSQFSRINNIIVHPNPTSGIINVSSNVEGVTFEVRDLLGKLIISESTGNVIDLSRADAGVYFLTIKNGDKVYNKRIIKE